MTAHRLSTTPFSIPLLEAKNFIITGIDSAPSSELAPGKADKLEGGRSAIGEELVGTALEEDG